MADDRERPLHELLSHDMVDIYVGPSNTHWVLHEKLLCYRSRFFRNIFFNKSGDRKNRFFGLPDEDDDPFRLFVGWLYSERLPPPKQEEDLSPLLDMYLMAEKWEIKRLIVEVLDVVRNWYHETDTWPSLRRVQYIYSNTAAESPMRQLLVSCVARMLALGQGVPQHWQNALTKNGQLAVDIILNVQKWKIEKEKIPDAREENVVGFAEEAQEKGLKMEDDQEVAGGVNGNGKKKEEKDEESEEEVDLDNTIDWGEGLTWSGDVSVLGVQSEAGAVNGS
ncbi:hypothetical protein PRZ48_003873 [Zasmidium cellare]|uniref:BTB domain-containing protein n=1 Tax=Zasmidium cellare TaxID=395010 RepID=A0ABR0EXK6_ZASCE|nr:hypothetical protein PRZ48_003873 [Zasmidium cellare]